jgi:cation:H+ antiporter
MILQFALLLAGLVTVVFAADLLVRGVSTLARAVGVPPLVIGLTIVAFGTSTPEIVINTISGSRGETSLAFGNVVGSTIVNIGFVLALTALVRPLRVEQSVVTRETPILLLAVAGTVVLSADPYLAGDPTDRLTRGDGLMLPITLRRGFIVTRAQGAVLPLLYAAYATSRLGGKLAG